MNPVQLAVDCRNAHGEGIFWSEREQRVYWTDIEGCEVWRFDPVTETAEHFKVPERLCAFTVREDGTLLAAFASGLALYNLHTKERTNLTEFEPELPTRFNDGRVDRQGRFVVGGMENTASAKISSVVRVNADFSVETLISGVSCANSTCFSPDGEYMYFADTPTNELCQYRYGDEGVSERRVIHDCSDRPGHPDGSTVDSQGYLWNAEWNGHFVTRYSPEGEVVEEIKLPVWNPTCVALGGKDLDTRYITSSRQMMDDAMLEKCPTAGGLFSVKVSVPGVPEPEFKGA